jgi:membrane-bound inhibitor of C-type lysozyme
MVPVAISAGAIAALLAGCQLRETAPPPITYPIRARFNCADFVAVATFDRDRVTLALPSRELTLPVAVSGSGARYADATNEFWNKGDDATFTLEGRVYNCHAVDK